MTITHSLGYPRIGANRELKFALEAYWQGTDSLTQLQTTARQLRQQHWHHQKGLSLTTVGDFSLYDHVLDMSATLGNLPDRAVKATDNELDSYFRCARGRARGDSPENNTQAGELTKWFDTNYHYIVPEFTAHTCFNLNPQRLLSQIGETSVCRSSQKVAILGPLSYLWLGKSTDNSDRLTLLPQLLQTYHQLLTTLAQEGIEWVQIEEPILVTDLPNAWQHAFKTAYAALPNDSINLLLTTYFGPLQGNLALACSLPVQGLHLDAVNGRDEIEQAIQLLDDNKVLSLGVINGRNIWKSNLTALLDWLEPIYQQLHQRLWLAPSCSLLHVPVDLDSETELNPDIRPWLAFARQKLEELQLLATALEYGRDAIADALQANLNALNARRLSAHVNNVNIQQAIKGLTPSMAKRQSPFNQRNQQQATHWQLPLLPTTTIGSFPQTTSIRHTRQQWRQGNLSEADYEQRVQQEIRYCIERQEQAGLDVLVHGEAERNDMVEYFGEQLQGCLVTRFGWVQSYGSRCVKPPIIYGDISRPTPLTVKWIQYAQSLTQKPVKGMLTGPVTLLNWAFVRDDQPRSTTCNQLALAIRAEVQDLESAGIGIVQIDEPALREGLPLRKQQQTSYLDWAVNAFRLASSGVNDCTQIHTHMCYSNFNDIIEAIIALDADVITIETSRADMKLLKAFEQVSYPNDIGPGVYDIHSPNIPTVENIVRLITLAAKNIPLQRLWINPDCGLKTRSWDEVTPALEIMVQAAQQLRREING